MPRSYKNSEEIYETDFIPCILWSELAKKTCEYCCKGDLIGIKGRLEIVDNKLFVIAEKVSFLSTRKEDEE